MMQKKEVPMVPGGIGLGVAPNGDLVIVQQAVAGLNVDDAEALCIELAAHVVQGAKFLAHLDRKKVSA